MYVGWWIFFAHNHLKKKFLAKFVGLLKLVTFILPILS